MFVTPLDKAATYIPPAVLERIKNDNESCDDDALA